MKYHKQNDACVKVQNMVKRSRNAFFILRRPTPSQVNEMMDLKCKYVLIKFNRVDVEGWIQFDEYINYEKVLRPISRDMIIMPREGTVKEILDRLHVDSYYERGIFPHQGSHESFYVEQFVGLEEEDYEKYE